MATKEALDNGLTPCRVRDANSRGLRVIRRIVSPPFRFDRNYWLVTLSSNRLGFVALPGSHSFSEYAEEFAYQSERINRLRAFGYSNTEIALVIHEGEQCF